MLRLVLSVHHILTERSMQSGWRRSEQTTQRPTPRRQQPQRLPRTTSKRRVAIRKSTKTPFKRHKTSRVSRRQHPPAPPRPHPPVLPRLDPRTTPSPRVLRMLKVAMPTCRRFSTPVKTKTKSLLLGAFNTYLGFPCVFVYHQVRFTPLGFVLLFVVSFFWCRVQFLFLSSGALYAAWFLFPLNELDARSVLFPLNELDARSVFVSTE
jgi:hypothetical protein